MASLKLWRNFTGCLANNFQVVEHCILNQYIMGKFIPIFILNKTQCFTGCD